MTPEEDEKATVLTQLSDEYFRLARTQKAENNQYLSLDEPVTVKLDGKVYRIEPAKDRGGTMIAESQAASSRIGRRRKFRLKLVKDSLSLTRACRRSGAMLDVLLQGDTLEESSRCQAGGRAACS